MARTITSANAVLMLRVAGVFDTPQQLQGFSSDDVFDTDTIQASEAIMGVDGHLSGGFIYMPVKQGYTFQADSGSIRLFDNWYYAQQAAQETFPGSMTTTLKSIGKKFSQPRGFLMDYIPMPAGKKTLQPVKFSIVWERITPSPV